MMNCFAKWHKDEAQGLCFRDQTILQFGEHWNLLANWVLMNPGSAEPIDMEPQDALLASRQLPWFVAPNSEHYYRFSIDRLMRDLIKLYAGHYAGGVIKIYNLFNLKNQHSASALAQYQCNKAHPKMFTAIEQIQYGDAPVVIATGGSAHADPLLTAELKKYIDLATTDQLYALAKISPHRFAITKADKEDDGLVENYHPSYTFKYGNETVCIHRVNQESLMRGA